MEVARKRKAKSPYQKYGKSPFRYSEAYTRWKSAAKARDEAGMRAASMAHRRYVEQVFGALQSIDTAA